MIEHAVDLQTVRTFLGRRLARLGPSASLREILPEAERVARITPERITADPVLYAGEPPHQIIVARREAWIALGRARRLRAVARARVGHAGQSGEGVA